ncbi:hypothetical protein IAR50_001710 [Cryptococcus sp. DSM 104548]
MSSPSPGVPADNVGGSAIQIPTTPRLIRHRSDTILSTSSSSSFPKIQTPPTPSISGRLSFAGAGLDLLGDESKVEQGSPSSITLARRASSHELGALLAQSAEVGRDGGWSGASGWWFDLNDPSPSQHPGRTDMPFVRNPTEEPTKFHNSLPKSRQTSSPETSHLSHLPTSPDPSISPLALPSSAEACGGDNATIGRRPSWFQKNARSKLSRSRSSFKLFGVSTSRQSTVESTSQSPSISSVSATSQSTHPRREKLKSLISFSRPRRISHSSQSSFVEAPPPPLPQPLESTPISGARRTWSPPPMLPSTGPSGERVTIQRFDFREGDGDVASEMVEDEDCMVRVNRKGKGRAVQLPPGFRPPMGVHGRHHSLPLPSVQHFIPSPTIDIKSKPAPLAFERLPHEIRVMIMRAVMEDWPENPKTRSAGVSRGRKELIRLSVVSKSWESLCFDGQLWPHISLSSFAHLLHPSTLFRLLRHSSSFITQFSLRGMDKVGGYTILTALGGLSADHLELRLETLDLQGCLGISSRDICSLVARSPHLRCVCLRSVPHVTVETLTSILSNAPVLEDLDVSYCSNILLPDLVHALDHTSHNSSRLRVLRMAGVKGMLPEGAWAVLEKARVLPGLEVLDLQGCPGLDEDTFSRIASEQPTLLHSLKHLNLSTTPLIPSVFAHLTNILPNLEILEMARIHRFYDPDDDDDGHGLAEMLKSMPKLRKVDLEDTAGMSGVCDLVLRAITPGEYEDGDVVGKALEELNIGYGDVTSEAVVNLINGCKRLRILDVDNTSVGNTVMRTFSRRTSTSSSPLRRLSLIDCRSITSQGYAPLSPHTRPRQGWEGWQALPFEYDANGDEMCEKLVLKTFWSWRRVAAPKGWRETRADSEQLALVESKTRGVGVLGADGGKSSAPRPTKVRANEAVLRMKMGRSRSEGLYDDRVGCIIA